MQIRKFTFFTVALVHLVFYEKLLIANALDGLFHFVDAQATSTNPGTSPAEFSPKRALQPGTGYWCSEGNHEADTVVSWIGTLNSKATLKGVKIRWAYSPREVKVAVSNDGTNEHTVLDWRRTPSDDQSFDEDIFFTKPDLAQVVKISMRGVTSNYFGINLVTPIASTNPIVLLASGISSPSGEMCLQVSNGDLHIDNTAVVLDTCTYAIAAGDGRELWRLNGNQQIEAAASKPAKCLTLQSMNTTEGGEVVITDCLSSLESGDGRSIWEVVGYGQVVLQARNKKYCLSQKGTSVGFVNVLHVKGAKATASSNSDKAHSPDKAIDGNLKTWWGSGAFPDSAEHLVAFDIDIGGPAKISKIRIDWEFPPFQYEISLSSDASSWVQVASSKANPANTTTDGVPNKIAQYIRVFLQRPHPRYGRVKTKFIYGIRDVQVLSNKLQSVVQDRFEAGNTPDARDKYFMVPVQEFDPVLSNKLQTMESDLEARIHGIQSTALEVEELLPKIENCAESMRVYDKRITGAEAKTSEIKKKMSDANAGKMALVGVQLASGLSLGDTKALAAEDCYMIKNKNAKAHSGFYWVSPRCSAHPFRAWCDMETGEMFFFWNGNPSKTPNTSILSLVNSVDDIRLHCAEMGLEPLILRSRRQVLNIVTAITKIGFDLNGKGTVPLAYDPQCERGRCTGVFRDFTLGNDVTSILMEAATAETAQGAFSGSNAAGLGLGSKSIRFFDLGSDDVSAIVCSTNTLLEDQGVQHVDIDCNTIVKNNPIFQGIPAVLENLSKLAVFVGLSDTNIVVECPAGCEEDLTLGVYGGVSVYHEASSVCRAGIHAGVVTHGGLLNVALEGPREVFEGSIQNGVQSKAIANDDGARSIHIGPLPKDCPIDMVEVMPSGTSFLQINSRHFESHLVQERRRSKSNHSHFNNNSRHTSSTSFLQILAPQVQLTEPGVPAEFNEILSKTYKMIDEAHGVDPHLIVLTQDQAAETIGRGRGLIKPAETMQFQQNRRAIDVFGTTEDVAETLYQALGQSYTTLEGVIGRLESLSQKRSQLRGYTSWSLNYIRDSFDSNWEVSTSFGVTGKSQWRYGNGGTGHPQAIRQDGTVIRETGTLGMGSFIRLKNRRFFDFVLTLKLLIDGDGPIAGIAFHIRDFQNMYLIELERSNIGAKRLIRIQQGVSQIICERKDGGYVPNIWYNFHIETGRGRIRVCSGEEGKPYTTVFDVQDQSFMAGSIGLFTSDTAAAAPVYFDALVVQSKHCTPIGCSNTHPPAPPECNTVTDSYFSRFQSFYSVQDSPNSINGPSHWEYSRMLAGRKQVIRQSSAISDDKLPGTEIIMKGYKTCPHGLFEFDMYAECADGTVGGIFRYRNEDNYYLLEMSTSRIRLKKKTGHQFAIIPPVENVVGGFNISDWTSVSILFNGPLVQGKANEGFQNINAVYKLEVFDVPHFSSKKVIPGEFRVGLSTTNCPNTLFDRLRAGPLDLMKFITNTDIQQPPVLFHTALFRQINENKPNLISGKQCEASRSYLQREELCTRMYRSDDRLVGDCTKKFCPSCCHYYTSLLSNKAHNLCLSRCGKNDKFSLSTHQAWLLSLSLCVGQRFGASDSLDKQCKTRADINNQMKCQETNCHACCQTLPEFDIFLNNNNNHNNYVNVLGKNQSNSTHNPFTSVKALEVKSCQSFCSKKYNMMQL